MNYKEKLTSFNSTDKYRAEMQFMLQLMNIQRNDRVLDYGCGLGTMMKYLSVHTEAKIFGFDITDEYYQGDPFFFRREMFFKVDKIYFMHSFAHIADPRQVLLDIRDKFIEPGGELTIFTPNFWWLKTKRSDPGYVPDPTVSRHYTLYDVRELLEQCGYKIITMGQLGEDAGESCERIFIKAKA